MAKYEFIIDPGHGWLKVPLADLPKDFKPTVYSFKDSTYAYLEEDCDALAFIKAAGLDSATCISKTTHVDNFNRNMARFGG